MPTCAEECLKYDTECLEMGNDSRYADQRERLLTLAKMWREMAAEKMATPVVH